MSLIALNLASSLGAP